MHSKQKKESGKTESLQKNLKSKKSESELPIGDNLRGDVDDLESMMIKLANMQKKQHKASKKR